MIILSIITVSYNSENTIHKCLESVCSQKNSHIEHIIIDGGSTDNTLNIVRSFNVDCLISEKDFGIFHAMNKGFSLSKGQYLLFLNSDDYLLNGTLETLSNYLLSQDNLDNVIFFSDILSIRNNVYYYGNVKNHIDILDFYRLPLHHVGSITSRSSFNDLHGFNEKYKLSSDHDFFLRAFLRGHKFIKLPFKFSCMSEGGRGTKGIIQSSKESGDLIVMLLPGIKGNILKYIAITRGIVIDLIYGNRSILSNILFKLYFKLVRNSTRFDK